MADGPRTENVSRTVLVAEDDREVRDLLRLEFELEGFAVLTAENGAEAIITAERLKPDVILMDMGMPIVDGIEATQRGAMVDALNRGGGRIKLVDARPSLKEALLAAERLGIKVAQT